ncbi:hypothetical protein UT300005_18400 [Clostridium sp. CTA-5]
MKLSFAQKFSLISLNSQDSLHLTTTKKVSLRCIAAAYILELYLNHEFTINGEVLTLTRNDLEYSSITLCQKTVLKSILGGKESLSDTLKNYLTYVIKLSNKDLKEIEHAFVDSLKEIDVLEEIPSLLGCDLEFHTSGILMKEYRSNSEIYTSLIKNIHTEILENMSLKDENILMLWLLHESGCLHDIFSKENLEKINILINRLLQNNSCAKYFLPINIHKSIEISIKNFLTKKKKIMSTPIGSGINFVFPIFQRSQSIFIETETFFSNKENRLIDLKTRLEHYGHTFSVIHEGKVPVIKIDNLLYEAIPTAKQYKFPVHGVRLRKYPIS